MKAVAKVAVVKGPPKEKTPAPAVPAVAKGEFGPFQCLTFAKSGTCRFGDKCCYPHVKDGKHVPTAKHPKAPDPQAAVPKQKGQEAQEAYVRDTLSVLCERNVQSRR